jgi:hypothetical protein
MLVPQEGKKLKHSPTGIIYEVKRITNQFVILYSMDGLSQILVEKKSLPSLFESEKVPHAEPAQDDAA